jgi:hypothetical protein
MAVPAHPLRVQMRKRQEAHRYTPGTLYHMSEPIVVPASSLMKLDVLKCGLSVHGLCHKEAPRYKVFGSERPIKQMTFFGS